MTVTPMLHLSKILHFARVFIAVGNASSSCLLPMTLDSDEAGSIAGAADGTKG